MTEVFEHSVDYVIIDAGSLGCLLQFAPLHRCPTPRNFKGSSILPQTANAVTKDDHPAGETIPETSD